uniref:Protein BIG1 n=1 Tax=Polytomella parva TaxID=51329 RepID=A0A7S0V4Y6_9CHLO|mmetsp:Transcript_27795/g.51379  ORF Transcript_27795/g.51379 Transcript_27795/m.51379 type:complete len:297 (+) Transcript_27795:80-970(+)|eukprot:CAMPEP_0175082902 /NCGR_PEP_ID=MMETSP0052_2-20121109/27026_1 /TAXON_ID=51329 ORGANISM="Polytomella parva, Strain SAG 63-3" /NCGR_SAMPLE_ID=MMETSP0052_2 /ASSEMBLY_ACC=CAM_ASM_000194 /LENGTH=296 /DNA_ID=CAMNT_0016354175 /DNA_START=9 /DNA_END=899 /DNA_ORIENTATION=-
MARSFYLATLLMLLPVALAASKSSMIGVSSPLIIWSSSDKNVKASRVSYEVLSDVEGVASDFVLSAIGKEKGDADMTPYLIGADDGVVAVFLGKELDTSDLRSSSAVTTLKHILDDASSSIVFPYAASKGSIKDSLVNSLTASDVKFRMVNCEADASEKNLKSAIKSALKQKPRVLLICPAVSAIPNSDEALESEMHQLTVTEKALHGVNHMVMYSSAPELLSQVDISISEVRRRSLLADFSGFGNYTTCGTLCQVQVRWLEALLAVLFMAIAACSGLFCLYILDTPTRFQVAKDV